MRISAGLRISLLVLSLVFVARPRILPAQAADPGTNPHVPANAAAPAAGLSVDQALAALHSGQPGQALAAFQQILAADPNNAVASLYAATSALELYNGALAVQYAEKARQLDPQSWKVHTTLVAAYAAAGDKTRRDNERGLLAQLHASGAPDAQKATGFLLEMFPVGAARVDAVQYFQPVGRFHTYYRFIVHATGSAAPSEIDVQSNDFDQQSWAQAHPTEAAAGERHFQLTSGTGSTDYRTFSGKPDYDPIRAMVIAILQAQPPAR
jgi:tetratricopeptide (TPR) repeat protein